MKKILLLAVVVVGAIWLLCRDSLPERVGKAVGEISKTCDREFSPDARKQLITKMTKLEEKDAKLAKLMDGILQDCKKESTCTAAKACVEDKMGDLSIEQLFSLLPNLPNL